MVAVQYECGLLTRGSVRAFLRSERFLHDGFEWLEAKSWLSSTFTIKGNTEIVNVLSATIDKWAKEIEK